MFGRRSGMLSAVPPGHRVAAAKAPAAQPVRSKNFLRVTGRSLFANATVLSGETETYVCPRRDSCGGREPPGGDNGTIVLHTSNKLVPHVLVVANRQPSGLAWICCDQQYFSMLTRRNIAFQSGRGVFSPEPRHKGRIARTPPWTINRSACFVILASNHLLATRGSARLKWGAGELAGNPEPDGCLPTCEGAFRR
jgi:hypothetical protein